MSDIGLDKWQIESWMPTLGSKPIRRVAHEDLSEMCVVNEAHVYELENGRYAYIEESGCSCYSSDDAFIDILPDEATAMKKYREWQVEQKKRKW